MEIGFASRASTVRLKRRSHIENAPPEERPLCREFSRYRWTIVVDVSRPKLGHGVPGGGVCSRAPAPMNRAACKGSEAL